MTAAHCAVAAGLTWKTNSGGAWGTGVQSDPGRDALLVRASSGKSFNSPTVWVGNQTTSDLRAVKAAGAGLQLGNTVALSGAISGLGTGQVASFGNYRNGVGPMTFVSYTGCQGGDSGGPWLQTEYGTGLVIAWGQHEGKFLDYSNGRYYCGFMPLNDISAALQASLFTY